MDISHWSIYGDVSQYNDDAQSIFTKMIKSLTFDNPEDGISRQATEVAMQAKFKLNYFRNLDLRLRFEE